jgi:hypothetical protein
MIRFQVDPEARIRIAFFEGVVDDQEVLGSYGALVSQPDYDPTLDDMVDMGGVERLEVSSETVRRLVDMFTPLDTDQVVTRLAIVAPKDHVFGMARMYEILRSDAPEQIRVFRDRDQAERWLYGGG